MIRKQLLADQYTQLNLIGQETASSTAITVCAGGAPKNYSHTDPNEDAAGFFCGPEGTLIAITDGHSGQEAANATITSLLDRFAPAWTEPDLPADVNWVEQLHFALAEINDHVLDLQESMDRFPRTTLAFALIRPLQNLFLYASVGDSHVFRVAEKGCVDLAWQLSPSGERFFIGQHPGSIHEMGERCITGNLALDEVKAVVLATDGLSESGIGVSLPETTVHESMIQARNASIEDRALSLAMGITQASLEAHQKNAAGDNIATAVAWIEPDPALLK